jgi:hypothetical protein
MKKEQLTMNKERKKQAERKTGTISLLTKILLIDNC